jgi:Asp/Glu/hydantoin racemase
VVRQLFDQPVFRIDEAMAAKAVSLGKRIGVLATLQTTLEPTTQLIRVTAAAAGRDCEVLEGLCAGAFDRILAGDGAAHDTLVKEGLFQLAGKVDVIVLAQASMARVLTEVPPSGLPVPVLSSPELALEQIRNALCPRPSEILTAVSA